MRIWLTRPINQAEILKISLQKRGLAVLHIPMLVIDPLKYDDNIKSLILNLDQFDAAVFISTNAATLGMKCVDSYWPQFPQQLKSYALGPSTAQVLQSYGLKPIFPKGAMTSEALLAMPQLKAIEGQKILIFQGVGGRELLAQELQGRGALVERVEIYQRRCPEYTQQDLQKSLENSPDAIVVTSAEALDNLIQLFGQIWPELFKVKLLVSSSRLREIANERGFNLVIEMSGANDEAIISAFETLGNSANG